VPTVSHVWVNPPSQHQVFRLAASVGSVVMGGFSQWDTTIEESKSKSITVKIMGPGQGFEPWRKAPQASMLPSYITPAADGLFLLGLLVMFGLSLFLFSEHLVAYNTKSK
jgi:hypothetical protein